MTWGKAKVQYTTDGGSTWNDLNFSSAEHIRSKIKVIEELKFSVGKGDISNLKGALTVRLRLYNEFSGTWNTWFKGETISGGSIKADGTVEVKARGGGHKASTEKYDTGTLYNTDNWEVLKESFTGSSIDPATTNWSIEPSPDEDTFPSLYSISSYSCNNKRSKIWNEMTNHYDWALYFETKDQEIRYEPNGYYTSGETIDTSSEATKITNWEDEIVNERTLTNKVIINYTDSNGNVQTPVEESDSTSINNYGEYMERKTVPYITTSTEASNIASKLLNPNPGTDGKIETFLYKTNLVNEQITIKDTSRGIDGDYVVKEQRNYYPERRTVLKIGDIDRRMTIQAREGLEHREERADLLSLEHEEVGKQYIDDDTTSDSTNMDDESDHLDTSSDNEQPTVLGNSASAVVTDLGYYSDKWEDYDLTTNGDWYYVDEPYNVADEEHLFHAAHVNFKVNFDPCSGPTQETAAYSIYARLVNTDKLETPGSVRIGSYNFHLNRDKRGYDTSGDYDVYIENHIENSEFPATIRGIGESITMNVAGTLFAPLSWRDDHIQIQYAIYDSSGDMASVDCNYVYYGSKSHDHGNGGYYADNHKHNIDAWTDGHSHGGDSHSHHMSAETASKLIDLLKRQRQDR